MEHLPGFISETKKKEGVEGGRERKEKRRKEEEMEGGRREKKKEEREEGREGL